MRRTKAQAQQTRETLMLAALDTFARRGVARATLSEIAQTAGVTRGALYGHFKNKEDLFDALFLRIFHDVSQRLEDDIRNNSPHMLHSLRQALINLFDRLQHNPLHRKFCDVLHLKCEHTADNAAIVGLMRRYQQMWAQLSHAALSACVRQGDLPADLDIGVAALHLKTGISGLMHQWLIHPEALALDQLAPRVIDAHLHALAHAPSLRLGHARAPQPPLDATTQPH